MSIAQHRYGVSVSLAPLLMGLTYLLTYLLLSLFCFIYFQVVCVMRKESEIQYYFYYGKSLNIKRETSATACSRISLR